MKSDNATAEKSILDMCCGSRMFWFDKQDSRAVFADIRDEEHVLCDGRQLHIHPDVIADFRALPFANDSFSQVVFDPPHLERVGPQGWQGKKYGKLNKETWRDDIRAGFSEAFRVLRPHGTLIFKWNETQIPVSQIIALTDVKPTIWQRTGKNDKTHWIIFAKSGQHTQGERE
ncbi:class I SAM-dependent methyltransferase [Serratia sp. 14-2641]|uniref:class I SAM-dependent methyltransferase n=1 Tax=Serratia sp. 14-2641 TaxID=1841657 RepID=UPI0008100B80|nr:class I SAM-dependent methyltransferase [Serratia sp. 14-2641]OCJ30615.1 methyltransferase [Serratia sp. 14-2641]